MSGRGNSQGKGPDVEQLPSEKEKAAGWPTVEEGGRQVTGGGGAHACRVLWTLAKHWDSIGVSRDHWRVLSDGGKWSGVCTGELLRL